MTYSYMLTCRLSDSDRDLLRTQADKLDVKPSEYVRYLIHLPVEAPGVASGAHCVVLDTNALSSMSRELTKWGYHYNQAVHAMNTIALFINRGRLDVNYFMASLDDINEKLGEVNRGRQQIVYELAKLEEATWVRE